MQDTSGSSLAEVRVLAADVYGWMIPSFRFTSPVQRSENHRIPDVRGETLSQPVDQRSVAELTTGQLDTSDHHSSGSGTRQFPQEDTGKNSQSNNSPFRFFFEAKSSANGSVVRSTTTTTTSTMLEKPVYGSPGSTTYGSDTEPGRGIAPVSVSSYCSTSPYVSSQQSPCLRNVQKDPMISNSVPKKNLNCSEKTLKESDFKKMTSHKASKPRSCTSAIGEEDGPSAAKRFCGKKVTDQRGGRSYNPRRRCVTLDERINTGEVSSTVDVNGSSSSSPESLGSGSVGRRKRKMSDGLIVSHRQRALKKNDTSCCSQVPDSTSDDGVKERDQERGKNPPRVSSAVQPKQESPSQTEVLHSPEEEDCLRWRLPPKDQLFIEPHWTRIRQAVTSYNQYSHSLTQMCHGLQHQQQQSSCGGRKEDADDGCSSPVAVDQLLVAYFRYCKQCQEFNALDPHDQLNILTNSHSTGLTLVAICHWLPCGVEVYRRHLANDFGIPYHLLQRHCQRLVWLSQRLKEMEVDAVEAAVLSVLLILTTDIPQLKKRDLVEQLRYQILTTLQAFITAKEGSSSDRLKHLLDVLPEIRQTGMELQHLLVFSGSLSVDKYLKTLRRLKSEITKSRLHPHKRVTENSKENLNVSSSSNSQAKSSFVQNTGNNDRKALDKLKLAGNLKNLRTKDSTGNIELVTEDIECSHKEENLMVVDIKKEEVDDDIPLSYGDQWTSNCLIRAITVF